MSDVDEFVKREKIQSMLFKDLTARLEYWFDEHPFTWYEVVGIISHVYEWAIANATAQLEEDSGEDEEWTLELE